MVTYIEASQKFNKINKQKKNNNNNAGCITNVCDILVGFDVGAAGEKNK